LLIAAAGLNRTQLKSAISSPEAQIVEQRLRRAFAIQRHLPLAGSFRATMLRSEASRERDLTRKRGGGVERLLRDRLVAEGIPRLMSPPVRQVPGLLVGLRKPDGIYPDPKSGRAPQVYLEIKNVRRVSDDIQKRLYEIAEVSLEMKVLYGDLNLHGFQVEDTRLVADNPELRATLGLQIRSSRPVVVAFLICPKAEAERYRAGAQAFIDRVFFQEEVEECLRFLREAVGRVPDA